MKAKTPRGVDVEYANLSEDEMRGLESIKKREDMIIFHMGGWQLAANILH